MPRRAASLATTLGLMACCSAAQALPVVVDMPFMNLEHRGINSLGFAVGEFVRIGATTVTPNGAEGTTAFGTTLDPVTGASLSRSIYFTPGPSVPGFFSRQLAWQPNFLAPWTLNFVNGEDVTQRVVDLPTGTQQMPFVTGITVSGDSTRPTFRWTAPQADVDGYRINIYDRTLLSPDNHGQVSTHHLSASVTEYTVDSGDFSVPGHAFQVDNPYTLEIIALKTRDGSEDFSNTNVVAASRMYADFTPRETGLATVNLPVLRPDGVFEFNMTVVGGETYFIDPDVAVGYDYAVGTGNPSFASVTLPTGIGDGLYDLYGLQGGTAVLLYKDLAGGVTYTFAAGGVTAFRVTGIELEAGLDPNDTAAFVTAVSFTGDGVFTGTQTPLTAPVPEPSTWALFGLGLAALAAGTRRRARG